MLKLEGILAGMEEMDEEFFVDQIKGMAKEKGKGVLFQKLYTLVSVTSPSLKGFMGVSIKVLGNKSLLGMLLVLELIHRLNQAQPKTGCWLEKALSRFDDTYCLFQTELFLADPWGFFEEGKKIATRHRQFRRFLSDYMDCLKREEACDFSAGAFVLLALFKHMERDEQDHISNLN